MSVLSEPEMRKELVRLFVERGAVRTGGPFKLKSGRESDLYVDAKKILMGGRGVSLAAKLAWLLIQRKLDLGGTGWPGVAGKAIGCDTLIGAMLNEAAHFQYDIDSAILRPEPKGHGLGGRWVTGVDMEDRKLSWVVVEDVSTTGGSAMEVVDGLLEAGQQIDLVLTVVDREEGAHEAFAGRNVPFAWLLRRGDLFPPISSNP